MIILRPYQIDLIDQIIQAVKAGYRKILIIAPTGSGKTVIMGGLLSQLILLYGTPDTLISVPTTNLVVQTPIRLAEQGLTAAVETYGSTLNRINDSVDILMIDEAHHVGSPSGQSILRRLEYQLLFGFTATPFRLDKNPLLRENGGPFEILIEGPAISDLTERGYLANLNYYSYPLLKETHKEYYYLRYGTRGERDVTTYRVENREHRIVEESQETFKGIPGFVFCKTIKQAENIAAKFNGAGVPAGYISCYEPKGRIAETIRQFQTGKIQMLCSCNMASEGLDISRAKLAIMARKIVSSVTLFIQQVGRTLRPHENQEASILDLMGNIYRFGSIEQAYNMEVI